MQVIEATNVNDALARGLELLMLDGVVEDTRAGRASVLEVPVVTAYKRPCERVLFHPVRDANPFFHVAEALWMLRGGCFARFLNNFVSDFGERFAEPSGRVHGAYGERWRTAFGYDQLDVLVGKLTKNDRDRQCVLQMWDARGVDDDSCGYGDGLEDLRGDWKDRPCNTHAYLRVRGDRGLIDRGNGSVEDYDKRVLDLTVCCRSNDVIWGAYGANAVHFSVLQEYLAARLGIGVGTYYQISNNFHVYHDQLNVLLGRMLPHINPHVDDSSDALLHALQHPPVRYGMGAGAAWAMALCSNPRSFDAEVRWLIELYEAMGEGPPHEEHHAQMLQFSNQFLVAVAWPMLMAHRCHKLGQYEARDEWTQRMPKGVDWQWAVNDWFARRDAARERREVAC